jgi:hypothetical protein
MPFTPHPQGLFPSSTLLPSIGLFPEAGPVYVVSETTSALESNLGVNEEFSSSRGEWDFYDAYDPALRTILRNQKHVDIRNFQNYDVTAQDQRAGTVAVYGGRSGRVDQQPDSELRSRSQEGRALEFRVQYLIARAQLLDLALAGCGGRV